MRSANLVVAALLAAVVVPAVLFAAVLEIKISRIQTVAEIENQAHGSVIELERKLQCMTRNIYYEAAFEPPEGKIAVAQVVMNRVASEDFPDDPCAVIYQKNVFNSRVVCQFSWLCDGSERRNKIDADAWNESRIAAKKVLIEGWRLPSLEKALYYHADYVNPRWRKDKVAKIGRHIFYQDRA